MDRLPSLVLLALLMLALGVAAWGDVARRIIPNRLNAAIALGAPLFWLVQHLPLWPDVAAQVAVAAGLFALFAALFAAGMMGGGDVKLIGAVGLWLPWRDALDLLVLTACAGGFVTVGTILWHRMRRPGGAPEVPYGVAIAFAAIACLGQRYLYQFP